MSGQSIVDRVTAAKHIIAGHNLAKTVCKATTEEVMGPKKKHLDYLVQCTNEPNVSIPQMADLLIERSQHQNWVVVFKGLVTVHNLMNYGNERFTQYLASNNCSFNLGNFLDKTGVQGYDMSTFIRRYAKYLNEKAVSYRLMAFDFCKVKRGKDDGLLRTMNTEKLLKALPVLQQQLDALLEFDCSPNELTNGVINACFMLMFKDLIRLFACYNDGIINLLEKYFEMNKKQCKEALDIYKKFLVRMDKVSEFLKVAESVGIDRGDIPDLAKAPSSLLDALEQHLASLEGNKKGGNTTTMAKPPSVTSAINTLAATGNSAAFNNANNSVVTDEDKKKILEEEQRQLDQMKEQKEKEKVSSPQSTNPFNGMVGGAEAANSSAAVDLFGASSPVTSPQQPDNDLFSLAGPGQAAASNPFSSSAAPAPTSAPPPATDLFGAQPMGGSSPWGSQPVAPPAGFDGFGELMQPAVNNPVSQPASKQEEKFVKGDLDSSMALLAGNLNMGGAGVLQVKKSEHQWTSSPGDKKLTGAGSAWSQPAIAPGTTAPGGFGAPMGQPGVQQPFPAMAGGMRPAGQPGFGQPGFGGGFQQPMGMGQSMPMAGMGMQQQPMFGAQSNGQQSMFGQPRPQQTQQPNDPFGAL